MIHSYKDLIVWQKSMTLTKAIYELISRFPKEEKYALSDQMRRAAVSIPSNIAEGRNRGSKKEFVQFLRIAYGSCGELTTQIEIAKGMPFGKNLNYNSVDTLVEEISKMLYVMIKKLLPSEKS